MASAGLFRSYKRFVGCTVAVCELPGTVTPMYMFVLTIVLPDLCVNHVPVVYPKFNPSGNGDLSGSLFTSLIVFGSLSPRFMVIDTA